MGGFQNAWVLQCKLIQSTTCRGRLKWESCLGKVANMQPDLPLIESLPERCGEQTFLQWNCFFTTKFQFWSGVTCHRKILHKRHNLFTYICGKYPSAHGLFLSNWQLRCPTTAKKTFSNRLVTDVKVCRWFSTWGDAKQFNTDCRVWWLRVPTDSQVKRPLSTHLREESFATYKQYKGTQDKPAPWIISTIAILRELRKADQIGKSDANGRDTQNRARQAFDVSVQIHRSNRK